MLWDWRDVSESMNVQVMGSSIGSGALNRYMRYMNMSTAIFHILVEVLLIPSYVGLSIQYGKGFLVPLGRGKIGLMG